MGLHRIRRGLDLPILGEPRQELGEAPPPDRVALVAADYPGLKPTMLVQAGDRVKLGQPLFEDKRTPAVLFTAPAAGSVEAVHRGERRALQSVVIAVDGDDAVAFESASADELDRDRVRRGLLQSGLWTALRGRPFARVANPEETPHSIFVTAVDTQPLAPKASALLKQAEEAFAGGVAALAHLTDGPVYVCTDPEPGFAVPGGERVRHERFAGPHPAGTPGFHIHTLDPVDRSKRVWYVGYQDTVAIGRLFATGRLDPTRIVSLAGPGVTEPRLLRTRLGASLASLTAGGLAPGEQRTISGSVLSGRSASGEIHGYLGRYHNQVSVLPEGRERELLGWLAPGTNRFSVIPVFASSLLPSRRFAMSTTTHGSPRAIVPIGAYERVWPWDILPTFLLRALAMEDLEKAEELGALELDEEDVSLLTFACPGKADYGPHLRSVLTTLETEG
jgi:Na+-transporting NADH:ubiquinone oxidoreductase subunit A